MGFTNADIEFSNIALELYQSLYEKLGLSVHPSKVMFLRTSKTKKDIYAYCKRIQGEYKLLTDKEFIIVIVSENFDTLKSNYEKKYVILHELKHLHCDGLGNYGLLKHTIQDFSNLVINPTWNLELIKNINNKDSV